MRKILIAVSAAALLGVAGFAVAEVQGARTNAPASDAAASPHAYGGMLMPFDTNHDGTITRQEFDAGRQAEFARLDTNSDGALTRDEMRAGRGHRDGGGDGDHAGMRDHMRQAMMARVDKNHDGNISRDEFLAGPIARFDRMDTNHDGVISADEIAAAHAQRQDGADGPGRHQFARFNPDANHDGSVSREEYAAAGASLFDRLDANHDGRVTQAELEAGRPHWGGEQH